MNEVTRKDRYRGALVGVHVGDSIGAPYETWGPKEIAKDIEARGGLMFFDYPNPWVKEGGIMPAGRPTDDSDQTAALADSLLRCGGLDVNDLRESLGDSVIRNKSLLWGGKAVGAGGTTRKALRDGIAPDNNIGTNGSLMRSAPMALYFDSNSNDPSGIEELFVEIEQMSAVIKEMSSVTHTNQHSIDACEGYTFSQSLFLEGADFEDALEMASFGELKGLAGRVVLQLNDPDCFPYDPGAWPARGAAEFSLYVALYAVKHSSSFAEGIEIAVRVGGDTDTYAAIAGGLLGTLYGYSGIPEEWRNTILGHDVMVDYADRFFNM